MPIKINVYNQKAELVGDIELSDKIFGVQINENLVHQAMVTQMANERQVLAHTKDRSEVRGGGRKPWQQKGTGRARAGSSRSPIWVGGGVTFGPTKDRNFKKNINRKMRQKAMFMVLSDKVANKNLVVLDKLAADQFKTKIFSEMIERLDKIYKAGIAKKNKEKNKKEKRSVLIVDDKKDDKVKYSLRNLVGVKKINLENINILDLLKYRNLIITKESIKKIVKIYNA